LFELHGKARNMITWDEDPKNNERRMLHVVDVDAL